MYSPRQDKKLGDEAGLRVGKSWLQMCILALWPGVISVSLSIVICEVEVIIEPA